MAQSASFLTRLLGRKAGRKAGNAEKEEDPRRGGDRRNEEMYVIAGLGNPGREYEKTRHNMGFQVIDRLSEKTGIPVKRLKHKALIGDGRAAGQRLLLVKPQTYMNNSGQSLGEILRYFNVEPDHLIVIYDDMDLETGTIRIRGKGGPGTHNGMKSVVAHVQSADFPRIRVGIGGARSDEWRDFVLNDVSKKDAELLSGALDRAAEAALAILGDGIDIAMNRFNEKKKKPKKKKTPEDPEKTGGPNEAKDPEGPEKTRGPEKPKKSEEEE